jgi:hypothetical protein
MPKGGAMNLSGAIESITFFYPAKTVGGAEFLFIRLAQYISSNCDIDVSVIDYKDGFLRSHISEKKVHFIDYEDGTPVRIEHPTHLITPPTTLFRVKNELALTEGSVIFLWVLHPYNFLSLFPFAGRYQNLKVQVINLINHVLFYEDLSKIRNAIRYLLRNNGLYFMDSACFSFSKYLFALDEGEAKYLPIPNLDKVLEAPSEIVRRNEVNIGWLGRLSEEKVYPLLSIMEKADAYSAKFGTRVVLHIIGEGDKKALITAYQKKAPGFEILFQGIKLGHELDTYLASNVDVLFAMGTSALEGAQLKLPTVVVGISFRPLKRDYKYKWLFNTEGYSLATYADGENNPYSFEEIMNEIYVRNRKRIIGEMNYRYYVDNHSMSKVSTMLISCLEKDTATLGDLSNETTFFENSAILNLYLRGVRVKNKIKRILGVR